MVFLHVGGVMQSFGPLALVRCGYVLDLLFLSLLVVILCIVQTLLLQPQFVPLVMKSFTLKVELEPESFFSKL